MEIAKLVLEYVRVFFSAPPMFAIVALVFLWLFKDAIRSLIQRVALIKFPGGAEVSTPQSVRDTFEESTSAPEPPTSDLPALPMGLNPEQANAVEQIAKSLLATAYLWEYRYLNHYLARGTQIVLDWFGNITMPVTMPLFEAYWSPVIPSVVEREAVFNALANHHLINYDSRTKIVSITPKGQEYRSWRGELPKLEVPEAT